jgi:flagellar biosynthesis protein FlhG
VSAQADGMRKFAVQRVPDMWQPGDDPVVVIGSGKGGSGGSTVAALLGVACAREGRRVLLIDGDEVVGTLHRIFCVDAPLGLGSLRDGQHAPLAAIVSLTDGLDLLPGGDGGTMRTESLGAAERRSLFRRLTSLYQSYDLILVDAGSRLDSVVAAAGPTALRFVAVSGAEPVALASAYALVKAIDAKWPNAPVELLVNRFDEVHGRDAFHHVKSATERFLGRGIGFAGSVPDDRELGIALHAGAPLISVANDCSAGRAAHTIAIRLLNELDDLARQPAASFSAPRRR